MAPDTTGSAVDPDDLTDGQRAVLALLREGRITAPFAAERTDYSQQYVRDVLGDLREKGLATRIHAGLYELAADADADADDEEGS